MLVYIFFVCFPIMVSAIIWSAFTSNELWQNEILFLNQMFSSASNDFYILTQNAVNIGNQVNEDRSLRADLSREFSTSAEHYQLYWDFLRDRFNMYLVSNQDIAEMTLYIDDPDFINCDYFRVIDDSVRESDWYKAVTTTDANILAYPASTSITIVPYKNRITVIRKIQRPDFLHNATNYLLIELRLNRVTNSILQSANNMDVYLTTSDNRIAWSTATVNRENNDTMPVMDMSFPNKYYVMTQNVGYTPFFNGWKLISVYDKMEIYMKQFQIFSYIFLITLGLSLFSVFLIWCLLNSMKYRITALSHHIKEVGGQNFEPFSLENPGNDEIGWLITAFNEMISEIKGLINDVYVLEMQKKDVEMENLRAEYKYLQAQVDPHFLFNTLNAILVFCVKNHYDELSSVISNLSKLLKRLLVTNNRMVNIKEEFDFIDQYLSIEKFRFGERFSYDIYIDPDVGNCMIPPLSIQPVVENACKHGLQAMKDHRVLSLCAKREGTALVITVQDNGVGMAPEKIAELLDNLDADNSAGPLYGGLGNGIGIQNVYRRMKMTYGSHFQFHMQSEPFVQTVISLRIEENVCTEHSLLTMNQL